MGWSRAQAHSHLPSGHMCTEKRLTTMIFAHWENITGGKHGNWRALKQHMSYCDLSLPFIRGYVANRKRCERVQHTTYAHNQGIWHRHVIGRLGGSLSIATFWQVSQEWWEGRKSTVTQLKPLTWKSNPNNAICNSTSCNHTKLQGQVSHHALPNPARCHLHLSHGGRNLLVPATSEIWLRCPNSHVKPFCQSRFEAYFPLTITSQENWIKDSFRSMNMYCLLIWENRSLGDPGVASLIIGISSN